MTIKTTTWRPDTCGCVLKYQRDTEEVVPPSGDWTLTPIWDGECKLCPIHQGLGYSANPSLYNVVLEENQRKNKVYGILSRDYGIELNHAAGDYQWDFDANRKLIARIKGSKLTLTGGQLNQFRSTLANELGGSNKLQFEVI